MQAAVHDALNAIDARYERYAFTGNAQPGASVDAAIAAATRDALVGTIAVGALPFGGFGSVATQTAAMGQVNLAYTAALAAIPDGPSKSDGIAIGQASAAAILALRSTDHALEFVPYTPGTEPGDWRPTPNPVPPSPAAGGPGLAAAALTWWGSVTPFVLRRSSQFEPNAPPKLSKKLWAREYNEVKEIGSQNSASRTADQSSIARFWYEGSPQGWNRIAIVVSDSENLDLWERARLLALVNLAMADGFIGGFETKYHYNFWRPVTAIRLGDTDGNDETIADATWSTYLNTPPIPDYTSTHSVLGGAAAEVLREYFQGDVAFTTTSGVPFAGITRSFTSFSQAAAENGESRIYAGIHFRSAVEVGIDQGKKIGHFVFTHALQPLHPDDDADVPSVPVRCRCAAAQAKA